MKLRSTATRYGSVAIGFHWLSAIIILAMLFLGFLMQDTEGTARLLTYRLHVGGGILLLVLTVLRLSWRVPDPKPELPADMSATTRLAARAAHVALYLLVIGMVGSGLSIVLLSGVGDILTGASNQPLPQEFTVPPRGPHGVLALVLIGVLVLHVAAALYHHVFRRDDVLRRMWPGGS